VIVHESIHAYISTRGTNNKLGLDQDPNLTNQKETGFGGLDGWMKERYPAVNQAVVNHRKKLKYNKLSLDIGPQSQKFNKSVVPNVPPGGGQP
jgi:hypothetical protein